MWSRPAVGFLTRGRLLNGGGHMDSERRRPSISRTRRCLGLLAGVTLFLLPRVAVAQGLTGALIGTVKDAQGGVLPGAVVRVSSPALIGGPATLTTNEKGQLRFPALPPGPYVLDIESPGIRDLSRRGHPHRRRRHHREDGRPDAGGRRGIGRRSRERARASKRETPDSGLASAPRISDAIPTRRSSMFDFIRAAPGISPTSPASGTATTVSAFGSGTNENQFLIDGTNFTCPCNGVARAEPGVDFIQEVQVQSVGASAEFGNVQGAVINVVTRQGSERFLYDASYYGQTAGLTSQPVRLPFRLRRSRQSGYERARYRDFTTNLGGPADSRSAVVLRGIPVSARLRQSAGHRPDSSRGPTSRTRSSRSSRGGWLRAGSWCRASTTSSGSTPSNRRS